jgi:hypothetical protein
VSDSIREYLLQGSHPQRHEEKDRGLRYYQESAV